MSIKCTEHTEAQLRNIDIVYVNPYTTRPTYNRTWQIRKRSLTSMGWRYHV